MFKKTNLFLFYNLIFIFGIFVATWLFKFIDFDEFYLFVILLFLAVLSILKRFKHQKITLIVWGIIFLFLGIWRFGLSRPHIDKNHLAFYNQRPVNLIGQIVAAPDIRATHQKLILGKIILFHKDSPLLASKGLSLNGKILVNAPYSVKYNYGDWLQVKCKLQSPGMVKQFDYGKYLATQGIYTVCYHPYFVKFIKPLSPLTFWQKFYRQLLSLKFKTKTIIDSTTAQPQNEILSAIILGLRKGIPQKILNYFSQVGLSHIIAISGLHISIVAGLLLNLFIFMGLKRRFAFYAAVFSLILFLILIGFRASGLRAGLMGFVALWALSLGRLNKSINALLLAAAILLLINPRLLLNDVGFQLSFLAVLGLIYLGSHINNFLTYLKIPASFEIKSSLMMTLSAQAMVLPLVIYYFGNLSLAAPLANILVLPFLPFIMILGFIQSLAGFFWLPLAKLIGYLTSALIKWIILVAQQLATVPYINFKLADFKLTGVIIFYLLLAWGLWLINSKKITQNYARNTSRKPKKINSVSQTGS